MSLSITIPSPLLAAPYGGQVTSGSATITQSGAVTNINQSTNRATINWLGFSIAPNETVNFNQPSALSMTLNRVIGNEKSIIAGALNANGRVYIINANGIVFTKGASVNVGGLVASTLNITDDDFNKGNFVFQGNGQSGQVINMGTIRATGDGTTGGYVALLGDQVKNEGVIVAERGTVSLNGAQKVTLNFNGDSLVNVSLDEGSLNALVETKNAIITDGGRVILTAKAANDLVASQVNVEGVVQARTLADLTGGNIEANAYGGTTTVSGTLDATAPDGGDGGTIETSGTNVKIADTAAITTASAKGKTGTWTIDPDGFTIAASGGNITGAALASQLARTNVTIESTQGSGTSGNIDVNAAVSWAANTSLTLDATHAININAALTPTGTGGGIVLLAGTNIAINTPLSLGSSSFTATAGDTINVAAALNWTGNQTLALTAANNINLYGTLTGGNGTLHLTSTGGNIAFDGVTSLAATTINASAAKDIDVNAALTWTGDTTATLAAGKDININAPLTATGTHAGLAMHYGNDYTIWTSASYSGAVLNASGIPVAQTAPAGAVYGSITLSGDDASLSLNGTDYTLIHSMSQLDLLDGLNAADGSGTASAVSGNYALAENLDASGTAYTNSLLSTFTGTFAGLGHTIDNLSISAPSTNYIGLIGKANSGSIVRDIGLVDATIIGGKNVGALVGNALGVLTVTKAYSTGSVTGGVYVGGLIGSIASSSTVASTVSYCNSTADVTATKTTGYVGGLVGTLGSGFITHSHATGTVHSNSLDTGGLVGSLYNVYGSSIAPSIDLSYASGTIEGLEDGTEGTGREVGGLVGSITGSTIIKANISNSFSTGAVSGKYMVGGLVGRGENVNLYNTYHTTGIVKSSYYGSVSGEIASATGGLAGSLRLSDVANSFATSDVISTYTADTEATHAIGIGGLIGFFRGVTGGEMSTITNSFATGSVTGDNPSSQAVGGLIGKINWGNIDNCWASGKVAGGDDVGGLVGYAYSAKTTNANDVVRITNSRAYGSVTGRYYVGGFVGYGNEQTFDDGVTRTFPGAILGNDAAYGDVTGVDYVGGIAGYGNIITDSTGSPNVTGSGSHVDPVAGTLLNPDLSSGNGSSPSTSYTVPSTPDTSGVTGTSPGQVGATTAAGAVSGAASTAAGAVASGTPSADVGQYGRFASSSLSTQTGEQVVRVSGGQQASASQPVDVAPVAVSVNTETPSLGSAIRNFFSSDGQSDNGGGGGTASYSAGVKAITADGVTYIVEDSSSGGTSGGGTQEQDKEKKKNAGTSEQ